MPTFRLPKTSPTLTLQLILLASEWILKRRKILLNCITKSFAISWKEIDFTKILMNEKKLLLHTDKVIMKDVSLFTLWKWVFLSKMDQIWYLQHRHQYTSCFAVQMTHISQKYSGKILSWFRLIVIRIMNISYR